MSQETDAKKVFEGQGSDLKNAMLNHVLTVWKDLEKEIQVEFLNEVLKNDPRIK